MLSCRARRRLAWAGCITVFVPVAVLVPVAIFVLAGRAWISRRSLGSCGPGRWCGGAPADQKSSDNVHVNSDFFIPILPLALPRQTAAANDRTW